MHQAPFNPPLSPPSSQPSRPNKVFLQREYREREGECINTLRDLLKNLTGEELRTRQEILRKAIEILSTAPELTREGTTMAGSLAASQARADMPPSWQTHSPAIAPMTSARAGYTTQSPHSHQNWTSNTEGDGLIPYHSTHTQDHQYQSLDAIATLLKQASPEDYGEEWPNHPLF